MKTIYAFLLVLGLRSIAGQSEDLAAQIKEIQARWEREAPDLTSGFKDTCPVHLVKMEVKVVPIQYGLIAPFFSEKESAEFPFVGDVFGGCMETSTSPQWAKTYVCPRCIEARQRLVAELLKMIEEAKKAAGR